MKESIRKNEKTIGYADDGSYRPFSQGESGLGRQ